MAAAIPLIASLSSVGVAGTIAAATSSLTGFLTLGGGFLAGMGALTGDKDLMKIGGIMSVFGGIGNLAGKMIEGGATAAGGLDAGTYGAEFGGGGDAAAMASDASSVTDAIAPTTTAAAPTTTGLGQIQQLNPLGSTQVPAMAQAPAAGGMAGGAAPSTSSLWDKALGGTQAADLTANSGMTLGGIGAPAAMDPLTAAASSMTGGEVNSLLKVAADKAKSTLTGIPGFIKDNKELVNMAGNALATMYGPQAEAVDFQKSLYERRRRNLNNPVRLGIVPGG